MRLRWVACPRIPKIPWILVAVMIGYSFYVLAGIELGIWLGHPLETCAFHATTGLPCPGCGSTRAVLALLHGQPLTAFRFNPLIVGTGMLSMLYFLGRMLTGRRAQFQLSRVGFVAFLSLLATLVLANWIWLLWTLP